MQARDIGESIRFCDRARARGRLGTSSSRLGLQRTCNYAGAVYDT